MTSLEVLIQCLTFHWTGLEPKVFTPLLHRLDSLSLELAHEPLFGGVLEDDWIVLSLDKRDCLSDKMSAQTTDNTGDLSNLRHIGMEVRVIV